MNKDETVLGQEVVRSGLRSAWLHSLHATTLAGRLRSNVSLITLAALCLVASLLVDGFLSIDNWANVLKQSAIPVIACIGMTIVLMTGGIDLSVGYVVGLASIVSGLLIKSLNLPSVVVLILVIGMGAVIGLLNGVIITSMRVPAFITTLGTGYIIYGIAQVVSQGAIINALPKSFLAIGRTNIAGLPSSVFIALAVAIIGHIVIGHGRLGRQLRAFGFNARAAALSGIPVNRVNVLAYMASGALAALSGLLFTIRVTAAQPNMGGGVFTFEVVTAAIVGGTSLFGGVGSVMGSVFGVLSVKVIENCINLSGVSYHLYLAVQGLVILAAIVMRTRTNAAT